MIVNYNIRVLGNGHIFVQYQEEGKARDAGFASWDSFIGWLQSKVSSPADASSGVRPL